MTVASPQSLFERRRNTKLNVKIETNAPTVQCPGISDTYDVRELLGHGSSCKVHRAIRRKDGNQVALKVMCWADETVSAVAKAEFSVLERINHPSIVRALDFFVTGDQHAVVALSFFDGKELGTAIRQLEERRLREATAHRLFVPLVEALDYLHQRGIIHCDVKPQNVLVTRDFTDLQLIDFNIAFNPEVDSGEQDLGPKVTEYAAPEVSAGNLCSQLSDIWGAGLCLLLMLSGQCSDLSMSQLPTISSTCRGTLRQCLAKNPSSRPTAMTLVQSDEWMVDGQPIVWHR
jgi:serine/threonine protein kinase